MHPSIDTQLKPGIKFSELLPVLKIIAAQNQLNLSKLSHYRRAKRILLISINNN